MLLKNELTILVCTCDSYHDLWDPFFCLLSKHWDLRGFDIVLNTETKSYKYNGLNISTYPIKTKKYGERFLWYLNKIQTKYTLLLLDDFFVRRQVDERRLMDIVGFMNNNPEVAAVCFNENPYCHNDGKLPGFSRINKIAPYKLNMQGGIWNTSILKSLWKKSDNPWRWEIFVNYCVLNDKRLFYAINNYEDSPIYYGYKTDGMGVYRGKWVVDDVDPVFKSNGINIDYSIRGVYKKSEEAKRLPLFKSMAYALTRMPFNYFLGFSFYELGRRIGRMFSKKKSEFSYIEYLSERKKK